MVREEWHNRGQHPGALSTIWDSLNHVRALTDTDLGVFHQRKAMSDEDMTPSDTNIDDKVSSFLHLHIDFWYNSLGSICTCCYLNVGINMSQSVSPSKLNF
jgi:hypothetical protein